MKKVEVFCGTGGVGKTTLASSRALYLAHQGRKVLLITIDPAKRLKQVLNIEENDQGQPHNIPCSQFTNELGGRPFKMESFDAILLSPASTFRNISQNGEQEMSKNIILKTLTKPYGGMNEIMAMVELQRQLNKNHYDTIVLDTPPGKHFIDFLESSQKIQRFFDSSFVEIFKYLGKTIPSSAPKHGSFLKKIVSTGIKKLLSYLEKVTGKEFVDVFIDAVANIYKNKEGFLDALKLGEELKKTSYSNWYLIASVDQSKFNEAHHLKLHARNFMHEDSFFALNRCIGHQLQEWNTDGSISLDELKKSMLSREERLKQFAREGQDKIIEFNEVFQTTPEAHVCALAAQWMKYDN